MKRKFLLFLASSIVCCFLSVSCGSNRQASTPPQDIIVLYENDVHCGVDGYANFAALKNEMKATHRYVTVVSNGDFVQGGSLGASSHGRNIINIMNAVGYDYVTLGNHEFDYGIPRQMELMDALEAECLCCNFKDLRTGKQIYEPYHIVNYGGFDVAYVGMSTPYTINSSTPTYFKDEQGNYVYSFCIDNFYETVQNAVNSARAKGADFVVVLSHLGDEDEGEGGINSPSMIENTYGIDIVLDGHSHSVILDSIVKNKKGQNVTLTSTGTKFQYMGRLTISTDGKFKTELIPTETYTKKDMSVVKVIDEIKEGYRKVAEQVIFTSDVKLAAFDDQKNRLVRNQETNIGNFCTDAYRTVFGTDIAFLGGGGIFKELNGKLQSGVGKRRGLRHYPAVFLLVHLVYGLAVHAREVGLEGVRRRPPNLRHDAVGKVAERFDVALQQAALAHCDAADLNARLDDRVVGVHKVGRNVCAGDKVDLLLLELVRYVSEVGGL